MKNKLIVIGAFIAFITMVPIVWCQCLTRNDTVTLSADKLYSGQRKFSVNLLSALQTARSNESLFFSPHSTYRALLLTYFGARGATEQSLKSTLQLDWSNNKADIWYAYKVEQQARNNRAKRQTVKFNSVDKLYISKQVDLM